MPRVISGKGTGSGEIQGAMNIPFIKIGDHVDVNFHLKWKHIGGPPLAWAKVGDMPDASGYRERSFGRSPVTPFTQNLVAECLVRARRLRH